MVAGAERIVSATGLDRETVLGDLAATALPAALAEAAENSVARPARTRSTGSSPRALAGGAPRLSALQRPAGFSLQPDVPETGPGDVATDDPPIHFARPRLRRLVATLDLGSPAVEVVGAVHALAVVLDDPTKVRWACPCGPLPMTPSAPAVEWGRREPDSAALVGLPVAQLSAAAGRGAWWRHWPSPHPGGEARAAYESGVPLTAAQRGHEPTIVRARRACRPCSGTAPTFETAEPTRGETQRLARYNALVGQLAEGKISGTEFQRKVESWRPVAGQRLASDPDAVLARLEQRRAEDRELFEYRSGRAA